MTEPANHAAIDETIINPAPFRQALGIGDRDAPDGFMGLDAWGNAHGAGYVAAGSVGYLPYTGGFKVGGGDPRMGDTDGAYISSDGHGNWTKLQSAKGGNPTELVIYASSHQGRAKGLDGTNHIQRTSGAAAAWPTFAVGDTLYFAGLKLRISSIVSTDVVAVTRFDGSPIAFNTSYANEPWAWSYTTGSGTADIAAGQIKFVSGTPFTPLFYKEFRFVLNGTAYQASDLYFIDPQTLGFTGAPPAAASGLPYSFRGDINDQITTLRVQLTQGGDEENLNVMTFAGHSTLGRGYLVTTGLSGAGQMRPVYVGNQYWGPEDPKVSIALYPELAKANDAANRSSVPDGGDFISLGGTAGKEAVRIANAPSKVGFTNRIQLTGSASGYAPGVRAMGADANVKFGIDMKGAGNFEVTQDYSRTIFHAGADATPNAFLELRAGTGGVASILAKPQAGGSNTDLALTPSGGGRVRFGSYAPGTTPTYSGTIEIKDATGVIRKLMVAT